MNVVWTENSEYTLNEIIEYIEIKFGLLVAQDYYFDGTSRKPRYYQQIAVNRTVEAIANGQNLQKITGIKSKKKEEI